MIEKLYENKIIAKLRALTESPLYPVALGVAAFVCYTLSWPLFALCLFSSLFTFTCVCSDDCRPNLGVVLLTFLTMRYRFDKSVYTSTAAMVVYGVFGALVLGGILFHFLVYKKPKHSRKLLFGLTAMCVGFLLGGIFSDYYRLYNLGKALGLSAAFVGVYLFFSFSMRHREDNLVYVARLCVVVTGVLALQVLSFYLREYEWGTALNLVWKDRLISGFGWGINNTVGEMAAFLLPAAFYLIYKEKYGYFYYIAALVGYAVVCFTLSRNALLFGSAAFVIGLVISCCIGKNKKKHWIITASLVAAALLVIFVLWRIGKVGSLFSFFLEKGFNDSGRFSIWKEYIAWFKDYPVFGVGFSAHHITHGAGGYQAHNTVVQLLASTGFVGFALYSVHRLQTIKLFAVKPNWDRLFMAACLGMGLLQSLLDPLFFRVYFAMFYSVILLTVEKSVAAEKK